MPRLLSSAGPDERSLIKALARDPLDALGPLAAADLAEERGEQAVSDLLRGVEALRARDLPVARPQLLSLLRGALPVEDKCQDVLDRLRGLLALPADQATQEGARQLERDLSAALGTPLRGEGMLRLLGKDGRIDGERLSEQYDFQVTLLASLDLLEDHNGHLGITGIDQHFHPLPSLDAIQERLEHPALRHKIAQGFTQLLLVPFALPLSRLLDAWRRGLLRNEHLLEEHGGLDREEPVWTREEFGQQAGHGPDEDGRLVYAPEHFARNHGGRTKQQLLASDPSQAWQVLLTEPLIDLPQAGQGQTLAGRTQLECGRTPQQYLGSSPKGEVGWTPEAYVLASLAHLERTGRVLDAHTFSLLTASYLPASDYVPVASWDPGSRQAYLDWGRPVIADPDGGARAAVRVV